MEHTIMWHRDPAKYKEFTGQENVIVGAGELIAVTTKYGKGWITPHHQIIYNLDDAIAYATKLDEIIISNRQRIAAAKDIF